LNRIVKSEDLLIGAAKPNNKQNEVLGVLVNVEKLGVLRTATIKMEKSGRAFRNYHAADIKTVWLVNEGLPGDNNRQYQMRWRASVVTYRA
jgi:hypothetical protein